MMLAFHSLQYLQFIPCYQTDRYKEPARVLFDECKENEYEPLDKFIDRIHEGLFKNGEEKYNKPRKHVLRYFSFGFGFAVSKYRKNSRYCRRIIFMYATEGVDQNEEIEANECEKDSDFTGLCGANEIANYLNNHNLFNKNATMPGFVKDWMEIQESAPDATAPDEEDKMIARTFAERIERRRNSAAQQQ